MSGRSMRLALFALLALCGTAVNATSANAAGDPDAAAGLIAERCTSCHEVRGYEAVRGRAEVGAPSFERIAKTPDVYAPDRLRTSLRRPHWPMTQFILSPADIDNVLAFIARLR